MAISLLAMKIRLVPACGFGLVIDLTLPKFLVRNWKVESSSIFGFGLFLLLRRCRLVDLLQSLLIAQFIKR